MKRTPFSVSNGRNHGNSLAAKRASDLALVNGTSEGALKGWETRRAGGGGLQPKDTVASVRASIAANDPKEFPEQRKRLEEYVKWAGSEDANKRVVDASNGDGPPLIKKHKDGVQYLHADNETYSNPVHPRSSTWDFPHDATKMHPTLKARLVKGGATPAYKNSAQPDADTLANKLAAATKPADALANGEFKLFKKGQNSLGDIAADESKDKEEDAKDGGIDEEKEGEGANKKMANGEFVLFKKGQNSLGDIKDDAKKEPEHKDGKGPNDDGDEEDKDGKKAWVPPWKKDGVENAGNSEGAHEGWLTRRGGVRAGDTFDHESGSGKHVKLTIQGQLDGQKNIELDLPKDVHTAIAAGSWKPNADFEKNSRGEDFHTIHGYEPVTKPGGIREKYGKGSEPDKANGLIGQNVSRAKAYYARARDFGDGTEAQNALKAKAESILKEIHSKYHPALVKAKAAHASSLGNRAYGALLNSFRGGLLKNYQHDVQEMLDEVADYASNGETLPDDLREQYEEWMDEQN